MYQERTYRNWVTASNLIANQVCQAESDLLILAPGDIRQLAGDLLAEVRSDLVGYIQRDHKFLTSLKPHQPLHDAPLIATRMADSASLYGVGPMAAVAGAIAECVGEQISAVQSEVVVENGGDIFIHSQRPMTFTLFAGDRSPFSGKLKFTTRATRGRLGVCTSSGTVGHSYSQGRADAVCVISRSTPQADAAATALANKVRKQADIDPVLEYAAADGSILGVLAALGDRLGIWGDVEIVR